MTGATTTEEGLAELLQIDVERMARLRREKKLPHVRVSKFCIRYTPEQVRKAFELLTVEPKPVPVEVPMIGPRTAASARRKRRAS